MNIKDWLKIDHLSFLLMWFQTIILFMQAFGAVGIQIEQYWLTLQA